MAALIYINKVERILEKEFSQNWWKSLIDKSCSEKISSPFDIYVRKQYASIIDNLILSTLLGEYIFKEEFRHKISSIEVLLDKTENEILSNLIDPEEALYAYHFNISFIKSIKFCISVYNGHHTRVIERLSFKSRIYIIDTDSNLRKKEESLESIDYYKDRLDLFKISIDISHADHFLGTDADTFKELEIINYKLAKKYAGLGNYCSLLLGKARFLLAKCILRKIHEIKGRTNGNKLYTREDLIEKTANESVNALCDENYSNLLCNIQIQYEVDLLWPQHLEDLVESTLQIGIEKKTLLEIQKEIKYFKDIKKSCPDVKKLREEIERRFIIAANSNEKFNFSALQIALNYAINNEFSCFLEEKEISLSEVKAYYESVMSCQLKTGIKNYFPQSKLIEVFFLPKIEQLKSETQKDYIEIQKLLNECNKVIGTYDDSVIWTNLNVNYIFQLPYNECLLQLNKPAADLDYIFIASFNVLPIDKIFHQKQFEELRNRVKQIQLEISIYENVKNDLEEINNLAKKNVGEVLDLKNEFKDASKKTIEIVGLFTAIVTFILGSIPAFKFVDSGFEALLFMLALGSTLAFFILNIMFAVRGITDIYEKNKKFIWTYFLFILVSWILLVIFGKDNFKSTNEEKNPSNITNIYNYNVKDSLKQNCKVDSLQNVR